MELSPQQINVMNWANKESGHLNLIARAGTGKTTTLLELCSRVGGQIFLGAYNASIAREIKGKLEDRHLTGQAEAATLHAAGFRAWRRVCPSVKVDENNEKFKGIFKSLELPKDWYSPVAQAVSIAKQSYFVPDHVHEPSEDDRNFWLRIFDHYGIDLDLPPTSSVVEACQTILLEGVKQNEILIDFDDMLYAPLVAGTRLPQYGWVFIDEAQDTNTARRELAIRMLSPTGRLVAVGDDRQAIYGFTGADAKAMNMIRDQLGSAELPLTVSYRCPRAVVRLAQTWVADIEAHPSAPQGEVKTIDEKDFSLWESCKGPSDEDVILCRNTKPLIKLAYDAIRRGRGVRVEGREIGKGLIKLAERFKETDLRKIPPRLQRYFEEEAARLREKNQGSKLEALEDKCETLSIMIAKTLEDGANGIDTLKSDIDHLFGDTRNGDQRLLTLSTIHKAKGREWNRVWLWGRNALQPSWYAKKAFDRGIEWPMQQENNLAYVACTRTKQTLIEVNIEPPWRKER